MADTDILTSGPDRPSWRGRLARLRRAGRRDGDADRLAAARRLPDHLRGLPLRTRLVGILVALALVALALTGALAVTLLRRELVGKVDSQVESIARRTTSPGGTPLDTPGTGDRHGRLPNTTYGAVRLDTGALVPITDVDDFPSGTPAVGSLSAATVTSHAGQPFTVPAQMGGGRWRVVALRVSTDLGPGTLFVGQSLHDVDDTVAQMTVVLVVVGLGVLLAVGLLGGYVVRRELRPLTEVEDVAEGIAGGDLTRRVPDHPASTEVGRLSASLNAMLSQIEQSFALRAASQERMRRFVSDASHELRTPLAAVRGYAELYRQGAVREPEQVAGAMRRIEDEATRMGGLVEDLLTLCMPTADGLMPQIKLEELEAALPLLPQPRSYHDY